MAKQQLTKEAISFIIECRDNPKEIHTWQNIADLVADKFGVKLSFQAIAKSYHTNKDKIQIKIGSPITSIQSTKSNFQSKKSKQNTSLEAVFVRGEDIDLKDLFDKAD